MVPGLPFSSPGNAARGRWCLHLSSLLAFACTLSGCHLFENRLERVRSSGELVVLTRTGPTTYYETPEGPAGFEHDLAKAFAEHLGVRLKIIAVARSADVLPRLANAGADLAAAGLTAREGEGLAVRFTPPYQTVRQQVVYRLGNDWPRTIEALIGRQIEVPADSRHGRRLAELKLDHPGLAWREDPARTSEDLLQTVWEGLLDITVADSHVISINRQFFPELQLAFSIEEPEGLAWALVDDEDDSLLQVATEFLAGLKKNGELAQLLDRYYGPSAHANFINLTVYQLRIQNRLPLHQKSFEKSAKRHGLDWRLLAAMGYQESYWDPNATSPTGVRGMMMLTNDTAEQLGVRDRLDPEQSIEGGAKYLRGLMDRIPETVAAPDRLWMALAAYNVGLGHLEDARIITQKQGGDPNRWSDVKERLPLLESHKWASQVKFGYARGREPVIFVNRVRTYYDVLVKLDDERRERRRTKATKIKIPAI